MLNEISLPESWDLDSEVLVIGAGNAGFPAAIETVRAGAKTVVLEQSEKCFGSLAVFFGKHVNFTNTDLQRKQGIEDSPDKYYEDAMKFSKGDPSLWRAYVDRTLETYKFIVDLGYEPLELWRLPGHSVPRGHFFRGGGPELLKVLERAAKQEGVEILFNHRAIRLLVDPKRKKVVGVQVEKDGKTLNFRARKAVIIASGGFGNNAEMVEEFRGLTYAEKCIPMMRGHTGEGIRMAMSIGAATRNIGTAAVASIPIDANTKKLGSLLINHILCGGILVNQQGKRFVNESIPKLGTNPKHPFIGEAAFRQPGEYVFVIYDSVIKEKIALVDWSLFKEYEAETIEALAEKIGKLEIDAKALAETVREYNEDIDKLGYDSKFGKKVIEHPPDSPLIKIEKAPFYAIKGMGSLTSFKGGLKINSNAQVLDLYGDVVPGLYAAGEATGGWFSDGCYIDGTMTSMSLTFGRLAGINAAAEKP